MQKMKENNLISLNYIFIDMTNFLKFIYLLFFRLLLKALTMKINVLYFDDCLLFIHF